MKQVFNQRQLIVMWIVGIVVCIWLVSISTQATVDAWWRYGFYYYHEYVNWDRALVYPLIIIGVLLVITFAKGESPKKPFK